MRSLEDDRRHATAQRILKLVASQLHNKIMRTRDARYYMSRLIRKYAIAAKRKKLL